MSPVEKRQFPRQVSPDLVTMSYRSRAVAPLSDDELEKLHAGAKQRNRFESVTGILIYENGYFYQWLEGPIEGIERICASIEKDPRHTDIEVLGFQSTPIRFFGEWDMRLSTGSAAPRRPDLDSRPFEEPISVFERVDPSVYVPLRLVMCEPAVALAGHLLSARNEAAEGLVQEAMLRSRSLEKLKLSLLEPAARLLGDRWTTDDCQEYEVTLGLLKLQTIVRDLSPTAGSPAAAARLEGTLLVAPQPGEPHLLGAAIDAELLWQEGWNARFACPDSDHALQRILADEAFVALELALSPAFGREHWLPRMRQTVALARSASKNPKLTVIVSGRLFVEHPGAFRDVGADASSSSQTGGITAMFADLIER